MTETTSPDSDTSDAPIATALTDSNVRMGDTPTYPRVGVLLTGDTAAVVGISSTRSGWYYIELEDGERGYISPNLVEIEGDVSDLEPVRPPILNTRVPTATPTPEARANLQVTGLRLDPSRPTCNSSFEIFINVQNNGDGPSSSSGTLSVVDRHSRTGSGGGSTTGGFPVIQPGASFVVVAALTVNTYFDEDHDVIVVIDPSNSIPETNDSDNVGSVRYNLRQGNCG
jgi:hypothetical protein